MPRRKRKQPSSARARPGVVHVLHRPTQLDAEYALFITWLLHSRDRWCDDWCPACDCCWGLGPASRAVRRALRRGPLSQASG
jgi:hypothetical protein